MPTPRSFSGLPPRVLGRKAFTTSEMCVLLGENCANIGPGDNVPVIKPALDALERREYFTHVMCVAVVGTGSGHGIFSETEEE